MELLDFLKKCSHWLVSEFEKGLFVWVDLQTAEKGESCLMMSVKNDDLPSFQSLIDLNADVNARNSSGLTAVAMTCATGNVKMAHTLLSKGADLTISSHKGATCAHFAARYGNLQMLELIFDRNPTLFGNFLLCVKRNLSSF